MAGIGLPEKMKIVNEARKSLVPPIVTEKNAILA